MFPVALSALMRTSAMVYNAFFDKGDVSISAGDGDIRMGRKKTEMRGVGRCNISEESSETCQLDVHNPRQLI